MEHEHVVRTYAFLPLETYLFIIKDDIVAFA